MRPSTVLPEAFAVDDNTIARALGCSVAYVRKDRRTAKVIPFFRMGGLIRYDIDVVRAKMNASSEGGPKGAA